MTKPFQRLLLLAATRTIRIAAKSVFASDAYFSINPDVANGGLLPGIDYFLYGAAEGRNPHPLFSSSYYLRRNPDVRASGQDPLLHYLRFGAAEGRDPHPLFQTSYYLSRYPDVKDSFNPLLHYLEIGQREHRQTSPFFDPEFYLVTQAGTLPKGGGVLAHYLQQGAPQGLPPSVDFDPHYYLRVHPDVSGADVDAFGHYLQFGKAEGRRIRAPRFESADVASYLPVADTVQPKVSPKTAAAVDIVIPVHRGLAVTRVCLQSVFAASNRLQTSVIVIDDATPEPELADYLQELSTAGLIKLIKHQTNVGFVGSVNEGMLLDPDRDVVLLHSDTEVFGNWVDRLSTHAYSAERVATVTPFSNNAAICSYPKICQNNALPSGVSAAGLDAAIFAANAGRHCMIPTGVGFCMYIRRDALVELGVFDQATFGNSYGEENDFSIRAIYAGWSNLLAADTFVYHAGTASTDAASEPLLKKHPRYLEHVRWHFQMNPANGYRIAATVYRMRRESGPVRLNVLNHLGGGRQHARSLERMTHDHITWLYLEPADDGHLRLYCERLGFEFSFVFEATVERSLLLDLIGYLTLERIHVHHLLGFPPDIKKSIRDWGIAYEITLHDYYFVCRRVNLTDEAGIYCGEGGCTCQEVSTDENGHLDLFSWRAAQGAFLSGAARIIAPSADTAERFEHYFPWLNVIAAWHEQRVAAPVRPRDLAAGERLKIAVLGVMAWHKGFANLRDCVRLAVESDAPVEFLLIGWFDPDVKGVAHEIASTGSYRPEDLPQLLERHSPHLVWFPCQWPETFSYTLSACLEGGIPVAVPDLGAFAERLDKRAWSWILAWDTTPQKWLDFFMQIRGENFRKKVSPTPPGSGRTVDTSFYPAHFLSQQPVRRMRPVGARSKKSVLALPAMFANGQVQACGYIRVIQPLTHPAIARDIDFHVVDIATALSTPADALIVQRTAVTGMDHAAELIEHCRKAQMRLVYEIDDDLFHLPEEHPDHTEYSMMTKAAERIARAADAVTVSTGMLLQMLGRYNDNVILIPNYIDERLWFPAKRVLQQSSARGVRALYMGTSSHAPDLAILEEPVRLVKGKFDFELDVIGVARETGPSPWFHCTPVPERIAGSYPNFVNWLTAAGNWHFGLAPLHESKFNAHKSVIKAYEYAALGLATVASAVMPYVDLIEDGKTGLLVRNSKLEWHESLALLCESTLLRQGLATEIRAHQRQWTLGQNAEGLRAAWEDALLGTRKIKQTAVSTSQNGQNIA